MPNHIRASRSTSSGTKYASQCQPIEDAIALKRLSIVRSGTANEKIFGLSGASSKYSCCSGDRARRLETPSRAQSCERMVRMPATEARIFDGSRQSLLESGFWRATDSSSQALVPHTFTDLVKWCIFVSHFVNLYPVSACCEAREFTLRSRARISSFTEYHYD